MLSTLHPFTFCGVAAPPAGRELPLLRLLRLWANSSIGLSSEALELARESSCRALSTSARSDAEFAPGARVDVPPPSLAGETFVICGAARAVK